MAEPEWEHTHTLAPEPEPLTPTEDESGPDAWGEIRLEGKPRTDLGGLWEQCGQWGAGRIFNQRNDTVRYRSMPQIS